ncbi:MAG TPA: recombinase family protein [Candidatus Cybelea sp.]|nr:recombinase family protein [Candidatus Cybelea sp.]
MSSADQAETLPYQRQWAEETASSHGWRLTRVTEGVGSGKAGPRRLVLELLADLRAIDAGARPEKLLMIRADRLGRGSIIESQIVLRDLLNLGVAVFTRDQGEVRLDSAMGELISAATLAVASHENEVKRDRIVNAIRKKKARGEWKGNVAPYGLTRDDSKDSADPERAPIVKEAFTLRLAGRGYDAIARRLTAIAPAHQFKNGKSRVVNWTPTRVRNLLRNRAYVPLVVDEASYLRAQRVADVLSNDLTGERRRSYPWPLSGCLKCFCGRTLIGMACGKHPWRYRYYSCKARWEHRWALRLVRADKVEAQFVELLNRLRASPALVERYRRRAASPVSVASLERSLREGKARLGEIAKRRDAAWELQLSGRIRDDALQERLDVLARQRDDLQAHVEGIQEQIAIAKATNERQRDAADLVRRADSIFQKADIGAKNEIARAVAVELGGLVVDESGELQPRGADKRPRINADAS